jgi:hypothetical protein
MRPRLDKKARKHVGAVRPLPVQTSITPLSHSSCTAEFRPERVESEELHTRGVHRYLTGLCWLYDYLAGVGM